jgi:hypothetical protein
MTDPSFNKASQMPEKIKEELLNEWDPIGVKGIPGAESEYDGYVPAISEMLNQQKTKDDLFNCLWWAETEHMGLTGDRQATSAFPTSCCCCRAKSSPYDATMARSLAVGEQMLRSLDRLWVAHRESVQHMCHDKGGDIA